MLSYQALAATIFFTRAKSIYVDKKTTDKEAKQLLSSNLDTANHKLFSQKICYSVTSPTFSVLFSIPFSVLSNTTSLSSNFFFFFTCTMPSLYKAVATIALLYAGQRVYKLVKNLYAARRVGLPLVFSPADQTNFIWAMASVVYTEEIQKLLPTFLWKRIALTIPGWEAYLKAKPFDQESPKKASFTLVGPSSFDVWTVDPQAVHEVAARHDHYEAIAGLDLILGKHGPNVMTLNGNRWTRHRKIVATVLNDRVSRDVFDEAVNQAAHVLADLVPSSVGKTKTTELPRVFEMLTSLTLNVLISSSLGDKFPWSHEKGSQPEPGYKMKYTESLHRQIDNLFGVGALPMWVLTHWPSWAPGYHSVSTAGQAIAEFGRRNKTLVDQERVRLDSGEVSTSKKADILTLLVQASQDGGPSGLVLSEEETISNLFVFMAGGFKTIAAALHTAMVLLAAFPEWQQWLQQEVDSIIPSPGASGLPDDAGGYTVWEYSTLYPKAVRIYAFLMELMRLYGTSTRFTRVTTGPQVLHTATETIYLPERTRVLSDLTVIHRLPCWRGVNHQSDPSFFQKVAGIKDEDTFRPSRWINAPGSTHALYHPPKGTFLPWGAGPRICPGQKMAQVEVIAVLLWILDKYRIEASAGLGETQRAAEARFEAALDNVTWSGIMQLKVDRDLSINFVKRR